MARSKEQRRKDYLRNREVELKQQKEYYKNNKEACIEYQKEYRKKNRKLVSEKAKIKRLDRKLQAIKHLGDKCSECGGSYHHKAYDFHHVDPQEKDREISTMLTFSEERFWNEVNKCILVCSNCHRVLHDD